MTMTGFESFRDFKATTTAQLKTSKEEDVWNSPESVKDTEKSVFR